MYRVSGAGTNVGLEAYVHVGSNKSAAYANGYDGVIIIVHGSEDYPHHLDMTAIGEPGDDVAISVVPTITVSEPSVRSLPVARRNCYFEDEYRLLTTVEYTYDLCVVECSLAAIYALCGCLPFFYAENRELNLLIWKIPQTHFTQFAWQISSLMPAIGVNVN